VAPVIARLSARDVLVIELEMADGVQVIVAKTETGAIAGSIVDNVGQLVRCIQQGNTYEAEVVSVSGGRVTAEVTRS
jgi:hypothetical protein